MREGADLTFDRAHVARDMDLLVRRYLTAGTTAVSRTTQRLEGKLESATQAAVPGNLWKAWQSRTYPDHGPAQDPTGVIMINKGARTSGAITYWTERGSASRGANKFYAMPLPAAGPIPRGRGGVPTQLTPKMWLAAHPGAELRFIKRRGSGRSALLVAEGTTNGRTGTFRPITKLRTKADERRGFVRGVQSVPIFVLVPIVNFRGTVAVAPLLRGSEGELVQAFFEAVREQR